MKATAAPERQTVVIHLPSILGSEHVAVAAAAAFARMHDLSPERIEDLKTIVAEAVTNAVRHGNAGLPDAVVVVRFEAEAESLVTTVEDQGSGFDVQVESPAPEMPRQNRDRPGGYGLFLIRKLADRLCFKTLAGGGHAVEMALDRTSAVDEAAPG